MSTRRQWVTEGTSALLAAGMLPRIDRVAGMQKMDGGMQTADSHQPSAISDQLSAFKPFT